MKNMKKLLAVLTTLGVTTLTTVNAVACGRPGSSIADNDLTKSFQASYEQTLLDPDLLASVGFEPTKTQGIYAFKFANITHEVLETLLFKNQPKDAPVKAVTKLDPATITAGFNEGDEMAQVVANTIDQDIKVTGELKTLQFSITLKLFKVSADKKYVDQNIKMKVTININTGVIAKNLADLKAINTVIKLNLDTPNLTDVDDFAILQAENFRTAIEYTLLDFAPYIDFNEFKLDFAGDSNGAKFNNVNLTKPAVIFVQLVAKEDAFNLVPNSKTQWLKVALPAANDLKQITNNNFGNLSPADFSGFAPNSITKDNIIAAIKKVGTLQKVLQTINPRFPDNIDAAESLEWIITTTKDGWDMKTPIDATKGTTDVYITLKPGDVAFVCGQATGLNVQIPQLS